MPPPSYTSCIYPVALNLTYDFISLSCTTPTAKLGAEKAIITIFRMMLEPAPFPYSEILFLVANDICLLSRLWDLFRGLAVSEI